MKRILFLISFFLTVTVHAANMYKLKIDFSIDGKKMPSSMMTVAVDDINTMTHQQGKSKNYLDVKATEIKDKKDQLMLAFELGEILEANKRHILSKPQIIVQLGKSAQITTGYSEGVTKSEISVSVVATKSK